MFSGPKAEDKEVNVGLFGKAEESKKKDAKAPVGFIGGFGNDEKKEEPKANLFGADSKDKKGKGLF